MVKVYADDQIKEMLPHRDPFLFVDKVEILKDVGSAFSLPFIVAHSRSFSENTERSI